MKTKTHKSKPPYLRLKEINSVWREALHLAERRKISKGHVWNDPNDETFAFLDKGSIRIEAIGVSGKNTIILHIDSGCIFRELFILPENEGFLTHAITLCDCIVYYFPKTCLDSVDFITNYPKLMSNIVYSLAVKASSFSRLLLEKGEFEPKIMVCNYLFELASQHSHNVFTPNISQAELALSLGLHRVTVCNVIKSLREEEIIGKFTRKTLEILNKEKLEEYSTS